MIEMLIIGQNKLKKYYLNLSVIFVFIICSSPQANGQGKAEDYKRADEIRIHMETKVYHAPDQFFWFDKGTKFWFIDKTATGSDVVVIHSKPFSRQVLFDHKKASLSLAQTSGDSTLSGGIPADQLLIDSNGTNIQYVAGEQLWKMKLPSYEWTRSGIRRKTSDNRFRRNQFPTDSIKSPDGQWIAFIKNFNIYIKQVSNANEFPLSTDGSDKYYYAPIIKWSPDSRMIATNRTTSGATRILYHIESSPTDQLQPKLHTQFYLKPGDSLPQKDPRLFDVVQRKQIPVQIEVGSLSNQNRLSDPVWRINSRAYTFEYMQRGYQLNEVISVDAYTGKTRILIKESSPTYIYQAKKFRFDVDDGKEIIWASERDGWNHLYRYDGATGKVINQITQGKWVVREVVHVDEKTQSILFEASGITASEDPYHVHYYRIKFDGTGLKALTHENANHLGFFSDDFRYFVDRYSRADIPPVAVLRSAEDGRILHDLEKADISDLLQTGWRMPEVFVSKGRDNLTDIWGIIVRPSNFDSRKKYPVIEYIYAGPHSSFVPKDFIGKTQSGDYRSPTALHELAELGFIVVQMDGMGTSNRSKAFQDVSWKNLKDAGFPDRIKWIKTAAAKYPYMDISQVGIYGNSSGGQSSAGALLFHPEFYKVAVSSSGCHDNRMDKLSWNEQFMGYPIGPQYAASSNVTHAANLTGKLLLILGEMDDNVDPASTLQLVNALIKANKNFDFLMVPGMGHSLGGDYGEHKRRDFFVKNLLHTDPPEWNRIAVN